MGGVFTQSIAPKHNSDEGGWAELSAIRIFVGERGSKKLDLVTERRIAIQQNHILSHDSTTAAMRSIAHLAEQFFRAYFDVFLFGCADQFLQARFIILFRSCHASPCRTDVIMSDRKSFVNPR